MGLVEAGEVEQLDLPEGLHLLRQTYEKSPLPKGAVVVPVRLFSSDWGGSFREASRVTAGKLDILQGSGQELTVAQINISNLQPYETRFWHIHPDTPKRPGQNEVWTINSGTLLVGLVDFRHGSETYGTKSKVILTPDRAVYIPKGVLHGFYNPTPDQISLIYVTDQKFDPGEDTQEFRVLPSELSFDWVLSEKV